MRPLPGGVRLEAEDGSAFAAKISPLMLVQTHEQRQVWHGGIRAGAIERFFKGEGHPLVKFLVEGAYGHVAAGTRASGSGFCEVTGVGLVGAVHTIERPTGVAPFRIRPKPARERQADLSEATTRANRELRGENGVATSVSAKYHSGRSVDGKRVGGAFQSKNVVVIGEELSAEIIAQVTAAIDFADERDPTGG